MKIPSLIIILIIKFTLVFAQTEKDTKDFIVEQITVNDPIPSYNNLAFFQNILRWDADVFAGKKISDEEYKYLFIYGRDCYTDDNRTSVWLSKCEVIDFRGITKVSTTRSTGEFNYYIVNVYLSGSYLATEYASSPGKQATHNYLSQMRILISDNAQAAEKIKKAIIHLGKLNGINIKDGDIF